jgi:hypothetical protein
MQRYAPPIEATTTTPTTPGTTDAHYRGEPRELPLPNTHHSSIATLGQEQQLTATKIGNSDYYNYSSNDYCPTQHTTSHNHYHYTDYCHSFTTNCGKSTNCNAESPWRLRRIWRHWEPWRVWRAWRAWWTWRARRTWWTCSCCSRPSCPCSSTCRKCRR